MPAPNGPQFDFLKFPKSFGATPIPEDSVRVNHYTDDNVIDSIREKGLSMQRAHESYARGGTEYPSIFANAGPPSEDLLRERPVVEAHIPLKDLDIGRYSSAEDLEGRRSTVTTNVDLPPESIINIHEPWHQTFRYIQNDSSMERGVMGGDYDSSGDKNTQKAVDATKITLAAKVMLGGRLEGREYKK